MAEREQQGTGKHPHKSTEEPWEHHEDQGAKAQKSGKQETSKKESGSREERGSAEESRDLKARGYRDEHGEIHHHTTTYMEQHGSGGEKSQDRGRESESKPRTSSAGAGSSDLKEREYRDSEGNAHHHTRTSEAGRKK